jgi:hypothetical protein
MIGKLMGQHGVPKREFTLEEAEGYARNTERSRDGKTDKGADDRRGRGSTQRYGNTGLV